MTFLNEEECRVIVTVSAKFPLEKKFFLMQHPSKHGRMIDILERNFGLQVPDTWDEFKDLCELKLPLAHKQELKKEFVKNEIMKLSNKKQFPNY